MLKPCTLQTYQLSHIHVFLSLITQFVFLPKCHANSLFFHISFNYSRTLISSNTWLHINVNLWLKKWNQFMINTQEMLFPAIYQRHKAKISSLSLGPLEGATFTLFSRKWITKCLPVLPCRKLNEGHPFHSNSLMSEQRVKSAILLNKK